MKLSFNALRGEMQLSFATATCTEGKWPRHTRLEGFKLIRLTYSADCVVYQADMNELAKYLAAARKRAHLSLRAVEASTGISNAYLSQLENSKIQQPSPNLLHKLAELYREDYRKLLELAGYPVPSTTSGVNSQLAARLGNTTKEEENALVEYLDFLRSRRKAGNRR